MNDYIAYRVTNYIKLNDILSDEMFKIVTSSNSKDNIVFYMQLSINDLYIYNSDVAVMYMDGGNKYLLWRNLTLTKVWVSTIALNEFLNNSRYGYEEGNGIYTLQQIISAAGRYVEGGTKHCVIGAFKCIDNKLAGVEHGHEH